MSLKKSLILVGAATLALGAVGANAEKSGALEQIVSKYLGPVGLKNPSKVEHPKFSPSMAVCVSDELTVSQIEDQIFAAMSSAVSKGDWAAVKALGLGEVAGFSNKMKSTKNVDGISESEWLVSKSSKGSLDTYLASFGQIEDFSMKITDYSVDPAHRDETGHFRTISADVRFDIRGTDADKKKRNDRGMMRAQFVSTDGAWKLTGLSVTKGTSLALNRLPAFKDITKETGMNQAAVHLRREAIRRGGYALSVSDVNGDQKQDIFVGMSAAPEVWLGKGAGVFSRQETTSFQSESHSKTAVFFDQNNSGKPSLLVNRYVLSKGNDPKVDVVVYGNQGNGTFVNREITFGDKALREPMPAAVADFNGDGFLDIYVGYPGGQDFSYLGKQEQKPLAQVQGLYLADGKGSFQDFTEKSIEWNVLGQYEGQLFPHASIALDFDQNGTQDIIVADDRSNLSPLFVNQGNGKFKEDSHSFGIENRGFAMSLAAGDLNNDGRTDLGITNVNLTEFGRMGRACKSHYGVTGEKLAKGLANGLRIFEQGKSGKFREYGQAEMPDFEGDATAGLSFFDYNNDGWQDVYVVNGLWSGTKGGQSFDSLFASVVSLDESLRYALNVWDKLHFMDALSTFKGKIGDYANLGSIKKGSERPSLGGFQRNRLYRNNGNGTFTEVGFLEGVDSIADGYIVAKANLTQDGKVDLVLRNADPGTEEYQFPVVQVYKNQFAGKGRSAIFTFQGTKSNRDGIGLFAKAHFGKTSQVQHLVANSGSVQDQRILHFGMGGHAKMDKLEIHWPSGRIQTLKNIKPGYHHITEGGGDLRIGDKPAGSSREISSLR